MLIIVCGLQGTGKSSIAKEVTFRINAVLLRTDVLRFQLYEQPTYTEDEKQRVYDEMFMYAEDLLKEGKNVVLDATFMKEANRRKAKDVAQNAEVDLKIVEVVSNDEIIRQRLQAREQDESEAEYHHYLRYKEIYEPIKEEHIIIDNSGSLEETTKQLDKIFHS
ncbi:AAA family ATPase [bacterium]|nr:AAA family ATPase [bacterium]